MAVLTGSSDGTVICWNIANTGIKRKFVGPPNSVVSVMQVILMHGVTEMSILRTSIIELLYH